MKTYILHYLASPFTSKNKLLQKKRITIAIETSIKLLKNNIHVFSPIAYNGSWSLKKNSKLPGNWNFWKNYDINFIRHCDNLIVLLLPGWESSLGVQNEIKYAKKINLPICYITPNDLKNENFKNILKQEKLINAIHKNRK